MRDISDRKRNEAKLRQLALHDELTAFQSHPESISGLVQSTALIFGLIDGRVQQITITQGMKGILSFNA